MERGTKNRYRYEDLASMIDHAVLHPTATDEELKQGCATAVSYGVASVCVKPYMVALASELLRGKCVAVGTVIGFPHGSVSTAVKRYETELACREGATEIDFVVNVGNVLSEDWQYVEKEIRAVVQEAHASGALAKVIFETDYITADSLKIRLCEICEHCDADFVKTSTGFGYVRGPDGQYRTCGATEHDIRLMRESCSPAVRVKASGGIRDLETLVRFRELGCSRVGTSATMAILEEFRCDDSLVNAASSFEKADY